MPWTPEQMMQFRTLTQPRVSPAGTHVVFTVSTPVMTDEKSEYVTQLYLAETTNGETRQITFGEKSSSDAQWSPDGRWLAFRSERSGKQNLYLMASNGGEAKPLTNWEKTDVGGFAWSPDSKQIAFLMTDPPTEDDTRREKARDDWRWMDEDIKQNHLYLVPIDASADGTHPTRKLTSGAFCVGGGFFGRGFDWSPDGKRIVFSHTRTPSANDWTTSAVSIVEIESEQITPLTKDGMVGFDPFWSPDGQWIALTLSQNPPAWAFANRLHLLPASGGEPRPLALTHDESPGLVGWSADSAALYFVEARGTSRVISRLDIRTDTITDLNPANGLVAEVQMSPGRDWFGFTFQTSDQSAEVYVSPASCFVPKAISRINAEVPIVPFGRTEVIRWMSTDGREIEGLLTYPADYAPNQRVPLILHVHGGPAGVFGQSFVAAASIYPTAAFASQGVAVLCCNPRGSSGYGREFRFANQKDWGGGDYQDLMTGVDHVIAMGLADPDRLGVMGWSYGGFMTSWILTQTRRFKAASVGAAVTNLMSFNGTADIPGFVPDYFGAQSWENLELYRDHSPMFQVGSVRTPALIQHCEGDKRVPISQGYELYNALKQQGVPVRMLVVPRQDHGPREPRMLLKIMQTNLEWFDQHLK